MGILSIMIFEAQVLDVAEWNSLLETSIFILVSFWYLGIGVLHSLIACALHVMIQKLKEGLEGLQQL